MGGEPGGWGPVAVGGRRLPWLRPLLATVATVMIATLVAVGSLGFLLYRKAEAGLTRVPVHALSSQEPGTALNVVVAGSDAREGLSAAERRQLSLGSFDGQRSDTVLLVSITPDRSSVSVLSFPRDLIVYDRGKRYKLTETFFGGPDALIDVMEENFDLTVNHYIEVSITGFLGVVDALGSVEICLDEPLRDHRSGADFDAGCQRMGPEEALAYVRSRKGTRGDFERMERQQTFLKAMLSELVSARLLTDVPRLLNVVEDVSRTVATDQGLSVGKMRTLAEELRGLADGSVPMTFVPGFTRKLEDGKDYVIPYKPGAEALFQHIRDGEPIPPRGSAEQRAETAVALWSAGEVGAAGIVEGTLIWAGFQAAGAGQGPLALQAGTRVYALPGREQQAAWVAATLGVEAVPLPASLTAPEGASVVVAVGTDALSSLEYLEPPGAA